jgi:hypothetical protein
MSSEDPEHPVEAALLSTGQDGWRAARPGEQTIRLIFDRPQHVRRIQLLFEERDRARTQEFALHWSPDEGRSFKEIVRQRGISTRRDRSERSRTTTSIFRA